MYARTNPQPPRVLAQHADAKHGGKRLCAHSADKNKRRAGILRAPSLFTPPTLSQENQDYFPLLSRPPSALPPPPPAPQEARERKQRCPSRSRWLSLGSVSASLHHIQFSRNQETLCNRGGGSSNQPGLRAGARALQSKKPPSGGESPPDKAAKVYVTDAPRTLGRSAPGARRPRAPGAGGEPGAGPGRQWAERLPCSCSRAREPAAGRKNGGRERGPAALGLRLGPGWGRAPGRRRGRGSGGGRHAGSAGAVAAPGDVC